MNTKLPPVKNGDTWSYSFVWSNNNNPINLTDCTAKMQVRDRTGTLMATASTTNGEITINGPTGTVSVAFPAATTASIPAGTYQSDLQVTFTDGTVQSSSTVTIIVEEGITQ
jgi:autotransporter translocation and assembly factor TamB